MCAHVYLDRPGQEYFLAKTGVRLLFFLKRPTHRCETSLPKHSLTCQYINVGTSDMEMLFSTIMDLVQKRVRKLYFNKNSKLPHLSKNALYHI